MVPQRLLTRVSVGQGQLRLALRLARLSSLTSLFRHKISTIRFGKDLVLSRKCVAHSISAGVRPPYPTVLCRLAATGCALILALALVSVLVTEAGAETAQPLSASASDPRTLGWMEGAPPPSDKRVMLPESDFFSFPKMRWTVCHIRELLPTERVRRSLAAPRTLERALDPKIDAVAFTPLDSDRTMTWGEAFAANYTDGLVILHAGRIVYERYAGCLERGGKHAAMSMTKSLTGLLAEILVAEGRLDPDVRVDRVIPELGGSAFADATVRQVMDMTTALDFSEDYADPAADIWTYSAAASPWPKPSGYDGPVGYYAYLLTVKKAGEHGARFGYRTVNTDALGWIIERTIGRPLTELLSERIWQPLGAEQDAYFTVDAIGTAFAGGGLSAGLRDMASFGDLVLNGGVIEGKRLFPSEVVASLRAGGEKDAFAKAGYRTLPGASYRSMWWILHNDHGAFAARGVHGQTVYIDPTADMVIARFASHPNAKNAAIDPTSLPAYHAVARYLLSTQETVQ